MTTESNGIGIGGLLAVLFIGLKLTGYIAWSWLWVLAPLWIPMAVIAALLIAFVLFCFLLDVVTK